MLILLLWNTGLYRNYEIAKIFNISYSSASKQVSNIKLNLRKDSQIRKVFEKANSLFKTRHQGLIRRIKMVFEMIRIFQRFHINIPVILECI
jgi:hypothetical protein